MKKLMIAMVVAAMSFSAMAQTNDYPVRENSVQTNGFWDNWFGQFGVGVHADGAKFGQSTTYNLTFGLGKWFTPGLALRGQLHGFTYDLNDGKDNRTAGALYAQALFNLSNMLGGYDEARKVSFIPYVGFGRAISGLTKPYGVWSPLNFGLWVPVRCWEHWSIDLEASIKQYNNIDGVKNAARNWMTGISVGATYYIGKNVGFQASPDMAAVTAMHAAQLAGLNEALAAEQTENKNLKAELAKKPKEVVVEKVVKEVLAAPQSVFFSFNSAKIASKKEIMNLESLANMAKSTGAKLKVTGYADSATGVPAYNQQLSERRAKAVAKELIKMGVAEENLVVEGKGGVADVKPSSYNRRVIIEAL